MQNDLISLLGMTMTDVMRSAFVLSLHEEPKVELIEDRFYIQMPASGLSFLATLDKRVLTVHIYSEGHRGYKGFQGSLPEGVSFLDSRPAVYTRLGRPSASGGGGNITGFLGPVPPWDRFDRSSYSLHVQYGDNEESISLVTLMHPTFIPA